MKTTKHLDPYSIEFRGYVTRKGAHIFRGHLIYHGKTDIGKVILTVDRGGPAVDVALETSADDFLFYQHVGGLPAEAFTIRPEDEQSAYGMFVIELFAESRPDLDVVGTCLGQHPVSARRARRATAGTKCAAGAGCRKPRVQPLPFSGTHSQRSGKV